MYTVNLLEQLPPELIPSISKIVQGNYTVKEYYSKLKECNLSKDYPEWLLKKLFFRGLSPEDILKVRLDGLQAFALDDIVERLSPEQCTEKIAKLFGLDEQNAGTYKALSGRTLEKRLEDYHFEYVKLKRKVNLLEAELDDLDECVDREAVVNLIHEIVPLLISNKGKALSESSENSNLDEIIEGSHKHQVRAKKDVPHKQQRKARTRKVKRVVV
ncbi:hypothetical protein C1646_776375 [Rhizophagus diaphanus]|nr:hypothetical protein C1646_776375 [Rhizophagus diaphanus] [Rhizophagus sp. MUCL 43196]